VYTGFLYVKSHKKFPISKLDKTFGGSCQRVYEDDRRNSADPYTTGSEVKSQIGLVSNPRGHLGPFPC